MIGNKEIVDKWLNYFVGKLNSIERELIDIKSQLNSLDKNKKLEDFKK